MLLLLLLVPIEVIVLSPFRKGNHMQAEQMFARAVTIGEKIEPAYSDLARYFIHSGDLHKERVRVERFA